MNDFSELLISFAIGIIIGVLIIAFLINLNGFTIELESNDFVFDKIEKIDSKNCKYIKGFNKSNARFIIIDQCNKFKINQKIELKQ